jgi:Ser/Thr protein kinase RdoA (MazF antagonist)
MTPTEIDRVLDAWRLPRPRVCTAAPGGYQNATYFVSCASGDFVVRVHTNVTDPTRQRFEHELLRRLATESELPFAVPRPLPSDDGDTLRVIDGRLAALFPRIPGDALPKDGGGLGREAAAALARLDDALGHMDRFGTRPPVFDGDLVRVHPLVDGLEDAIGDAGLSAEDAGALGEALSRTAELAAPLYASLPQQVTHGDFAFGNTLAASGRVVAVLDFEHAGVDVRAMDLAVALFHFPAHPNALAEMDAFGRGYSAVLALDPAELLALPALLLVRAGVSVVHWIGRYRAGLSTTDDVRPRAGRALFTHEWVERHGENLVRGALGWIGVRA